MSDRIQTTEDKQPIEPEIIASDGKNNYQLSYSTNGVYTNKELDGCLFIGYSLRGKDLQRILPEGFKVTSIKVRTNVAATINKIHWSAPDHERNPNSNWSKLQHSKIINLDKLAQ